MALDPVVTRELALKLGKGKVYGQFIGGKWIDGNSGQTITLQNPATGAALSQIARGDSVDVERAVEAAYAAFPSYSRTSAGQRQEMLLAIAKRISERKLDYAMMETLNNGKTITEAFAYDIGGAIAQFEYWAGAAFHIRGETADFPDATMMIHREPIGVVAQITPWNAALYLATVKLAPALAAGCTIVLKPSEVVCMSVLEFISDIADLVPPGVINVVSGYGSEIGEALVSHPKVRKVSFTGSRPTAQRIIQYASANIIPQTMELGGKSANIVCDDANIEGAVQSAVLSAVYNKGEVCLAGTRVFVHKKIEDQFVSQLTYALKQVKQGDPTDPATNMGPQAFKAQFEKVVSYLELGVSEGATASIGGAASNIEGFENGFFIQPTVFTGVDNKMRIAQEEIFGPVLSVIRWDDEAEMLKQANDTQFGLGGGIWTKDLSRAHRISRGLDTGMIWVNRYYNFKPGQPIGGHKQSGFGVEGTLETLKHYTVTKSVVINLDDSIAGPPDLH